MQYSWRNSKQSVIWTMWEEEWILLVCFSRRYEATEGPRVNFVMREALFEIYTWILCPSLHTSVRNKQVEFNPYIYTLTTLSKLYRFGYEISWVPMRNIRFLIQNTRSLFYRRHYSSLHRLMSLHGKLNVKIFLMFIVAENTGSVNIIKLIIHSVKQFRVFTVDFGWFVAFWKHQNFP